MTTNTPSPFRPTATSATVLVPRVDLSEDSLGLTLWADLPGVPKENLHLRVEGDLLSIDAEVPWSPPEGYSAHHIETRRTHYRRAFTLGREFDTSQVAAELESGVLRVRIAKAAHAMARKIDIQTH